MTSKVRGEFIAGAKGPVFVLLREPSGPSNACVLLVPPFGEEMNKSRRMMTCVASALAEKGVASVLVDLYGTGDSAGEFVEASWATWKADIAATVRWYGSRERAINAVLAVRLGCALAQSCIDSLPALDRTVLWQPVFDGNRFLTQLLRMRLAAMLAERDRKETMADLKALLSAGTSVEVAGYELSPALAGELESLAAPASLSPRFGEIHWLEVAREVGSPLPAPSVKLIDGTRAAGIPVHSAQFAGEPFWAATEIVENQAMVQATVDLLASCAR